MWKSPVYLPDPPTLGSTGHKYVSLVLHCVPSAWKSPRPRSSIKKKCRLNHCKSVPSAVKCHYTGLCLLLLSLRYGPSHHTGYLDKVGGRENTTLCITSPTTIFFPSRRGRVSAARLTLQSFRFLKNFIHSCSLLYLILYQVLKKAVRVGSQGPAW